MSKNKVQQVRKNYGDTIEEFAWRLNTLPKTVAGWEAGQKMQEPARALLEYARKWRLDFYPRISEEFAKLSPCEQIQLLMNNFGDTQAAFAKRIGVSENNICRWKRLNILSPVAQRYIQEVAAYPERFISSPKSYLA